MTRPPPARAIGVCPVPYESEPEIEEPPTLDLTLPPPGGIPWRTVRNWAIVAIGVLATCLLVLALIGLYRSEGEPAPDGFQDQHLQVDSVSSPLLTETANRAAGR